MHTDQDKGHEQGGRTEAENRAVPEMEARNAGRRKFEAELMKYLDNNKVSLLEGIREKRELNDDLKAQLKTALNEFKGQFKSA